MLAVLRTPVRPEGRLRAREMLEQRRNIAFLQNTVQANLHGQKIQRVKCSKHLGYLDLTVEAASPAAGNHDGRLYFSNRSGGQGVLSLELTLDIPVGGIDNDRFKAASILDLASGAVGSNTVVRPGNSASPGRAG